VDAISDMLETQMSVQDKSVLVIGSQSPWLETILLAKGYILLFLSVSLNYFFKKNLTGAKNITTFDYVKIKSHNPKVSSLYLY